MVEKNEYTRHRRSIRLKNYDYSQNGLYFVTICANERRCLFGDIADGIMQMNDAGVMTHRWFIESEHKYPDVHCDEFICMPNHVHFIITTTDKPKKQNIPVGADLRVCPSSKQSPCESTKESDPDISGTPLQKIVQWYKTMTTNEYIRRVKQDEWSEFHNRLWQRNYWEHIIRNEQELQEIREYIRNNPVRWTTDELYNIPIL